MTRLKICFAGTGSIGGRHLRNLHKVANGKGIKLDVYALRSSDRPLSADISPLIDHEVFREESLPGDFDIAFIANPTALHFQTIKLMRDRTRHMFIEKPLFESLSYGLDGISPPAGSLYYVAAPLRFSQVFGHARAFAESHAVYCARIICSSYMPDWQPGRDYRQSFRTRDELGGGVDIDLVHEIDYMVGLFGMPKAACRIAGHYSSLVMDAPDFAGYLFDYGSKAVEMHLDYFGRKDERVCEIYTGDDVYVADFFNKRAYLKRRGTVWVFDPSYDHYLAEMRYFIGLVLGERSDNPNDIDHAYRVLGLAKGVVL